jgi:Tol biopolymer transport system component
MLAWGETGGGEKTIVVTGFSADGEPTDPRIRIPMPMSTSRSFVSPCPVWAPDGRHLATVAPDRGVLVAQLDGSTTLVELDAYGLREGGALLRWSPDGSQLALLVSTGPSGQAVWLIRADGGDARPLSGFDPSGHTNDFAWSPDGRSVVAVGGSCCPEQDPFVEVLDVESGESLGVLQLAASGGSGITRILTVRDGRYLVWRAWKSRLEWLEPDGSVTPVRLAYPPTTYPQLSPDGEQILYVTYDPAAPGRGQFVVAAPLDGGPATVYSASTDAFGDNYATLAWQPR